MMLWRIVKSPFGVEVLRLLGAALVAVIAARGQCEVPPVPVLLAGAAALGALLSIR